jgi:tetratricopeptide (TPR) repeat protein
MLANPTAFEYQDLLNSAVTAARSNRTADAGKLFEATLVQNPNSRDALYNVAVTYLTLEQNEKVGPIVTRLVAVDPGNPENYNLAARAYLSLAKVAEKAKKTAAAAAYNDTTLTWYNNGNKLPIEVTFSEFSPGDKQVVIGGSVLDRRDKIEANNPTPPPAAKPVKGKPAPKPAAAATKTYTPKPTTLNFVALDKTGAVVGTETVTTDPLSPGQRAKFKVTIASPGVVAYRYTIVE